MDWQDISTAPKDGTEIIGWIDVDRSIFPNGDFHIAFWSPHESEWIDWFGEEYFTFTHWMPLPAPPE